MEPGDRPLQEQDGLCGHRAVLPEGLARYLGIMTEGRVAISNVSLPSVGCLAAGLVRLIGADPALFDDDSPRAH
jgi:hypothetical protein